MKKIIKIIAFVTLIVCSISNANVAFAKCPRASLNKVYEHTGDCVWEHYNHKTIQTWLNRDKETKDKWLRYSTIFGTAVTAATFPVFGAGSSILGALVAATPAFFSGEATQWVKASEDNDFCGVKIHYCKNQFGKMVYKGFEPQ